MPGNLPLPPPSVIASWPKPNYVDPVERTWFPPYAISLLLVSTVMVLLRLGLRLRNQGGGLGLDDALLVPAWLFVVGFTALGVYASEIGIISRHTWDVEPTKFEADALNAWIASFVFLVSSCFLKVSVLLFHRRIQSGTYSRGWMIAIYGAIAFTVAYTLALILALVFNCSPTRAYWKAYDPEWPVNYHCVDTGILNLLAGLLNVFSDLYAIILPCLMLQKLDITKRQKIVLNGVFAISLTTAGAGAARSYSFYKLSRDYDITWIGFWVYVWATLELELGIICACAPSLRVFISKHLRGGLHYMRSHSSNNRSRNKSDLETDFLTSMNPQPKMVTVMSAVDPESPRESLVILPPQARIPKRPQRRQRPGVFRQWSEKSEIKQVKPSKSGIVTPRSGIRTPRDYEEYALAVVEKSRRSLMLGSVRPRPDRNKDLPPPPPTPAQLEAGMMAMPKAHTRKRGGGIYVDLSPSPSPGMERRGDMSQRVRL